MGNELSEEQRREREQQQLDTFVRGLTEGPDLRVNQNIVKFCSLDSSENLRRYYKQRKLEAADCAADWIKNLVEKLAGLTSAPELAGLGALVIAILIDVVSFSPPEESTKEALRCVFAEEKASEVWDQIDREMIEGKCSLDLTWYVVLHSRYLVDEDSDLHIMRPDLNYNEYFEAYYNHRYSRQKSEVQQYFRGVGENLQSLVHQTGSFTVQ